MNTLSRRRILKLLGSAGSFAAGQRLFAASSALASSAQAAPADLVVYGATASGVMTAYSAAREGLHVVLLEPGHHLGGMVTGGLSATDLGHYTIIGGYP